VPIAIAAIDPCFSCTDRMIGIRRGRGTGNSMRWDDLRNYGVKWYRKQGIDFTDLNRKLAKKQE